MAHILGIILLFIVTSQAIAQNIPVGAVDLAGWVKGADGTYSRAFADGSGTRANPTNTTVTSTQNAQVSTSKGLHDIEIQRSANVNTALIGAAVVKFAKKVGPIGMAVGTASLICELTTICDQAGQWMMSGSDPMPGAPNSYPSSDGKWSAWNDRYTYSPEAACGDAERIAANVGPTSTYVYDHIEQLDSNTYKCFVRHVEYGSIFYASNTSKSAGCPSGYEVQGSNCVKIGATESHVATADDWNAKQSLLNDSRFTSELTDKGEDVPTGIPTLTPGQKKDLGLESKPTKDAQGNVTGHEDTVTTLEPVDAATADAPGRVIFKETTTNIKYDINNNQISSTTSTNYQAPPLQPAQSFEIKFDEVPEAAPLFYNVPNTFSHTSWGSGSCPPDIDVPITGTTLVIPTQPVCDLATMINPFVLMISTILGIYIISGVRGGSK